jgi:hypothetical protein
MSASALNRQQFTRVPVPQGHGADDYESDEGEAFTIRHPHGYLDYNLTDTSAHVRWVESRKPGTGGALVRHLASLHPDRELTTGGFTDEGERLRHYFPARSEY